MLHCDIHQWFYYNMIFNKLHVALWQPSIVYNGWLWLMWMNMTMTMVDNYWLTLARWSTMVSHDISRLNMVHHDWWTMVDHIWPWMTMIYMVDWHCDICKCLCHIIISINGYVTLWCTLNSTPHWFMEDL